VGSWADGARLCPLQPRQSRCRGLGVAPQGLLFPTDPLPSPGSVPIPPPILCSPRKLPGVLPPCYQLPGRRKLRVASPAPVPGQGHQCPLAGASSNRCQAAPSAGTRRHRRSPAPSVGAGRETLPGTLWGVGGTRHTKRTHESWPQPVPAVTPILAENGVEMPGVRTPPPAARSVPSITGTAGLSWGAEPVPRTVRRAAVFLGRFGVLWASRHPEASVAPSPSDGGECPASPQAAQGCCTKRCCRQTWDFTSELGILLPLQPVSASSSAGPGGGQ